MDAVSQSDRIQFTAEELGFLQGVLKGMQFQGNAEAMRRALALHEAVMEKVEARLDELEQETRSAPRGKS